ncbi:YwqJ-related putative deaminase [Nocardia neocaledoniensis]|uniref:WXG100-like domain-containing protein n=1 Tax=Nocardia neocaledoniensis TaxID=236511 RepID=UPI0024583555|nr:YwqJ-related putative deaminase [Nocardia neocaledoniensis]
MIDLPSGLHWLSILAGMEWPEGNEDEMWAMAEDWRTAADSLRGLVDDIDAAKDAAFKAYPQGEGVDDMLKAFEGMARGDQSVTKLAELFDTLGDSVYQTGTEIEYTKIMFLSSLGLLALEIAAAWVFPPTAPAVQAAAVAATRIVARTIFGRVVAAILRHGAKAVITRVLKFIGQHVAIDTALGTLQELGVQQWQVDQGHRKEVDWNQVKAAAVSSAAGGLAAGPFGNFLGKKLGDGMAPWLKGAITGTGAGLVGAGGGMLGQFGYEGFTQGWDKAWENLQTAASDPLMWSAGASNGGLSGLNKAGANSAWSAMKPGLFERPSFSSQIRDAMGPGYDLGTFGQSDGAGGDGSSNRPGGAGENRAGADDGATGAGGDDGVRAGAGEDTMGGEGSGETRAGAGDDSQSMRPAGATQSPEGEAPAPTNADEGRANQQSGDEGQSTADGGGSGAGRQDAKPEVQTGESQQAGDGGRQDGGARAEGESPATQSDSAQDKSRAGEAEQTDGASVGEGTRTDAQSSGQPVAQSDGTQTTTRDTTTQAAGAPIGAGMTGAGPAATAGPTPAATGQAPVTTQGATPATGQPSTTPTQSPTTPTQSTPAQQSTPGQQSTTPNQGSQPGARPGSPEVRSGTPDGVQSGSDIRSGAPEVRTDSPAVDESGVDPKGTAEEPGAPTSRPEGESRAGVGEQRGAGLAETPLQGLQAAPGEAPPVRPESEVTAEPVRARDTSEADPLAEVAPIVPIVGAEPGASPGRSGPETGRPGRAGTDDTTTPRDRADGDDRRQPEPDDNGPVYDTRLPNGQGVVHHPTGTAIGEDARTHRVSHNVRNDGAHDVVVHGRRDGSVTPSNGDPVHPQDIVDAIRSNPNYVPGTPIRLVSCFAGDVNGWAQYIADALGADVTAPTDRVGVRQEPGSEPVVDRGGKWRTFSPEPVSVPDDLSSLRPDAGHADPRDLGPLDGDAPPLDRDLVDFMSDDEAPTRPAAMSFLTPEVGVSTVPFSRTPGVDAHLLGVLDPNDPMVQTAGDPPRITHVGGEPIDEFSHRLSEERGRAFVDASTPDAALVAEYEQHKAQQKALADGKAAAGREVRDANIKLKEAQNARDNGAENGDQLVRDAEKALEAAKKKAETAKNDLNNFLAADKAEADAGNSPAKRLEKAEAERLPAKRRGHVSSITIDRLTGRVYEAANGTSDQRIHPNDLHPTLHDNVSQYQDPTDVYHNGGDPRFFPHTDNPLGHAEIRGTNAALHDRELLNQQRGPDDQLPTDFDGLASILNSPYVPSKGAEAPCCANCTRVVQGTESTAGHIIDEGAPRVDPIRHADIERAAAEGNVLEPRLVSPEYPPDMDFMGDDDDVAGPDRGVGEPVPPGMVRGDDGLLHRPGDRTDSYREPDGTWHHVDDPADTFRDKRFRLQNDTGGFYRGDADPLAGADYEYKVQKGDSDPHTMQDPGRADELKEASDKRLELQTQRDKQRVKLDRLMAEFGVTARNDLAPDKVAGKIADLSAALDNDATLTQAEKEAKAAKLTALEATANKYFKMGVKMVALSKLLGETAGLDYALSRPGSILLTPFVDAFDGAGVVDIASIVPPTRPGDPPTLLVVEAKGVGATLGGSKIARAEQGSPEYLRRTLEMDQNLRRILNETPEQMRARGIDPDTPAGQAFRRAVAELLAARENGTLQVEYKLVHATAKGEVTVTDLQLVRDGTDVLADVPLPVDQATLDRLAADDSIDYMGDEDGENRRRQPDFADPEPPQREVRVELGDNGEVVALHVRLDDGQWVVARTDGDEGTQHPPARRDDIPAVDSRNALRRLVDQLNAGYGGLNLKYPSGSGLDGRGQTAIRDGVTGGAHMVTDPPAPAQPAPPPVDGPVVGAPPPGPGDPALNVARIGREGLTWYHNRENIPFIGPVLGRQADSAGTYQPVYFPDGTEYRPWITDANPNDVRETVVSELRANRMDADEARDILKELFDNARDPRLRQDLIDDLEFNGLVDTDEARAMEDAPIPPPEATPEQQGPPPEGETLTEMAERLGIDLDGEGPQDLRRAIDRQSHRLLREIGAIEGLADAARRADEEQTRPYRRADHPADPAPAPDDRTLNRPDQLREIDSDEPRDEDDYFDDDEVGPAEPRSHWGDTSAPRPVPFSREVSFLDKDPLGRFLRDLIVAFEGVTALRDYDRVGNGADRLPEWASFSDDREPGRDEARAREFFEHALRRDQLRDELSSWAAMFGRDLSDLSGDRMEPTLNELRESARQRAQNLADFIAAAQPILQGDGAEPVGRSYGDQVARVPDADGGPDRLLVVDGPLDREEALARALRDNPELAVDIDNGVLRPDFRAVHADGAGRQFLDPVATPEVQHIRRTVDGAELQVTMMRGEDGEWRPVQPAPEPPPTPRDRAQMVRDIVDLARELHLGPAALHPDNIDATIRALHLDNAVRAGQTEALADYARTMADIETFYLVGDARDQLATRLGIPEGELTPRRIAEALVDPKQRRGTRQQQFEDLLDGQQREPDKTAGYSQQLRNVDDAAVKAAQEALIRALSPENPETLRPKVSKTDPVTGRSKVGPADSGIDPAKLRKLVTRLNRRGAGDYVRDALAAYADVLMRVDPYTDHPAGTRAPDPRTTGDPHIYDPGAIHGLRDVVGAAEPGADPLDFAAQVADNVARSYGADRPADPNDPRPQPNRDWARLVGVDVSTADDAKFVEIYEAYRDGKIEKHEGLSPEKLAAEIAAIRAEIRLRTEQIEQLKALTDEFYRPVADLPPAEGSPARELPGPRPAELPGGRRGLPAGPEGGRPRPIGPRPEPSRPDAEVPPERGADLDDRADAKLDQTMRKLDEVADELAEPMPSLDDLVGPGEPVDPLAAIDAAVERQNQLHDQADERRADQADAALDETMRDLDGVDADVAALESYLRAQREFEAAQAEIASRFEELATRDAEAAARRGDDSDADLAVRAADLAALESFLAAQQKFDALRAELAEAAQTRPEDLDAEALADAQALESYLRAQQEFDAARAEMAARFAAAVERHGGDQPVDGGDQTPAEEPGPETDRDGSRDDDDDSGEPPAASTQGGPPSKPPSRPPTAPSPEPEEPSKNRSPFDFTVPKPAELAVPGDAALDQPVDGAEPGAAPERAYQRRDFLNDVHQFLRELSDLPPSAHADVPPLSPEQAEQVRKLAEALGLGDALTGQRDPLGALAEIADMARARGFLDSALDPDAELGKPMRYPDDYEPLDVDELQDGLDHWRVEGDPEVRSEVAEDLRRAGFDDDARPALGTDPEPNPQATPLQPSSILPPEDGARQPGGPRIEPAQQAMDRLAARFGVDLSDPGALDAARYRQLMRAGAVEAFAAAVRHAEAATDPQQRAMREAVARRWAARLGLPADPGLTRAADDINRLRAAVTRDAGDMAHLYQMVRNDLDDRVMSLDVDGDKVLVRLVADGPDSWHLEPVAHREPKPFRMASEQPVEVPPKKNWLRRLWDRLVNRGYHGENPKYPSGSSLDGAGQSMLGHSAGLPLTTVKDSTPDAPGGEYDQLQIKFNPARILKEGVLMWQNRELVPILKHLSSRIADQAGEFLPLRNLDGTEYKPWISDADPELRRQIEQDLRDAGLEHLLEPESLTPRELAARETKELPESDDPVRVSRGGEEVPAIAEPLPPWLREVVDAVNGRISDATVLEALAHELGVRITDFSEEGLRTALAEAEYRLLRRDGVIQALEAAARFFNAENAEIPFRPANFHSKDPLGAYLKEVVAARGDQFAFDMLNSRGVNNGGELPSLWADLADDGNDPTVLAEDARKIFDDALRRAGLRDERSTWAHLAGADLEALVRNLDAEIAALRGQLDDNVGRLGELTRRVADFNDSDSGDRLVLDPENGRIAIVDTGAGHEAALARALAEADADFVDRLNRGEIDIEIRAVGIDANGRVHLLEVDAPEVRHLRTEVDGRTVDATTVREGTGPWRLVELPPQGAEPTADLPVVADDTNQPIREPRSLAEVRVDIAEVAGRLGIDDPSNLSAEQLDRLLAEQERANQVRARQVEGLVDYARSADAIDNFNALHNVRSALALRFGVTPEALSPEVIANGLADPATRVELHRQRSANLTEYAKLLHALNPVAVHAALDALAPHLGLPRGGLSLDAAALAEAVSNRAARGALDDLTGPLTDYVRALAKIDPYADNLVYDPEADPRAIGDDPPVHPGDSLDFLREVGADDLSDRSPLAPAPEDAVPGPSRDHARLLGVDLTDADDRRVAQVYEWFRDGRIDKHERLTLEQLAQVHAEIRDEIRQRAADITRLRELLNEPFVTDPELGGSDRPALDGPSDSVPEPSSRAGLPTGPAVPGTPVRPGLPAGPEVDGTSSAGESRGTAALESGGPRPEVNGDSGTPPAEQNGEPIRPGQSGAPSEGSGGSRPVAALEGEGQATGTEGSRGTDDESEGVSRADDESTDGSRADDESADESRGDDESGDPPAPSPAPAGPPGKPPAQPPTALSPEPEEPSKSSSPVDFTLPKPAELAVPGDAGLVQPGTDAPADPPSRAQQRSDLIDDVRRFLQDLSDLPPSAHADVAPLTPQQAEQVRRLAEAMGLGEALTGQRDPLGALAEIADMARARGFLDSALDPDAELGKPMRYPDDYEPLDLDQLQDGLEQWRVEGDPDVRADIAEDLRRTGLDDGSRPGGGAGPAPAPPAQPQRPAAGGAPGGGGPPPPGARTSRRTCAGPDATPVRGRGAAPSRNRISRHSRCGRPPCCRRRRARSRARPAWNPPSRPSTGSPPASVST